MSASPIVTLGYGPSGGIGYVVRLGYSAYDPIDYDVDESDVFRARQRRTRFDARRATLATGRKRITLAMADMSKTERA